MGGGAYPCVGRERQGKQDSLKIDEGGEDIQMIKVGLVPRLKSEELVTEDGLAILSDLETPLCVVEWDTFVSRT